MSTERTSRAGPIETLLNEVRACTACIDALPLGPRPLLQASASATILIIGQAPGARAHRSGVPFSDPSGDRLREWMGISNDEFYDEKTVAIVPMGFCYPGRLGGGDAPPRRECAPLWRDQLLALLPRVRLTLLLGTHAQNHVLGPAPVARRVKDFGDYLPRYFPLPHPSWRSRLWEEKNPWFREDVIPALRSAIEGSREANRQKRGR
jgi:uracil-DNA glycosylase family 4